MAWELSIENPFGDCSDNGHQPKWTPYPKRLNTADMRYGTVRCNVCLEHLDFGVTKGEASGNSYDDHERAAR